jgi:hypothetical protein
MDYGLRRLVVLEWNWAILYVINAWWFIPGREFTAHDWPGRPYPTYDWDYQIDPGGSTIPSCLVVSYCLTLFNYQLVGFRDQTLYRKRLD